MRKRERERERNRGAHWGFMAIITLDGGSEAHRTGAPQHFSFYFIHCAIKYGNKKL